MNRKIWLFTGMAMLSALCMAGLMAPYASSSPDGLERVAADKGFLGKGEGEPAWRHALMPDYAFRGLGEGPMATAAAGVVGTLCAFAAGWGFARLIRRRKTKGPISPSNADGQLHEGPGS